MRRLAQFYGAARLGLRLTGAGVIHRPQHQTVAQRLAAFPRQRLPVSAAVDIHWNAHLVPFIEARTDRDLAVALGAVHAHLRLAQMELLRRIAQGRLAAILGPLAADVDHALRLLDPIRAVAAILGNLPEATLDWLDGFVAGINHHLASAAEPPLEFRLLGIRPAPWSVADVLGVARLAAADVNWMLWLRLLRLPRLESWPDLWPRLLAQGAAPMPSLAAGADRDIAAFARLLFGLGRSGSNAAAVAGERSATGHPWLFGDPHLSVMLPSVWLAAAYRSPSYAVSGLMIPGIPVMAIGRNPWLAWGGTNLHAASSELFDVGALPAAAIRERRATIEIRWSRPRDIVLRETEYGPILSDAPIFGISGRIFALRWVGHMPSDEISALLAINRARDWASFRAAADGFAVPGQTLVCATAGTEPADHGHVGRLCAARVPRRAPTPPGDLVSPVSAAAGWTSLAGSSALPAEFDPPRGFVVSANERPPKGPVPVGWFFSSDERARRLTDLLDAGAVLGFDHIARMQRDVTAPEACVVRDRLCAALAEMADPSGIVAALAEWDAGYEASSPGALAYELILARLATAVTPHAERQIYGAVWAARRLYLADIEAVAAERLTDLARQAAAEAAPAFNRYRQWGAVHRLRLSYALGPVPFIGRHFRAAERAWPGSNHTLLKSSHGLVSGRHAVGYGSNARYVFDLADLDANHLVLLGGQDGAPGSVASQDQVAMFARGDYMRVPLRPESARTLFPLQTRLDPAA